jgi:hypothetical protein
LKGNHGEDWNHLGILSFARKTTPGTVVVAAQVLLTAGELGETIVWEKDKEVLDHAVLTSDFS